MGYSGGGGHGGHQHQHQQHAGQHQDTALPASLAAARPGSRSGITGTPSDPRFANYEEIQRHLSRRQAQYHSQRGETMGKWEDWVEEGTILKEGGGEITLRQFEGEEKITRILMVASCSSKDRGDPRNLSWYSSEVSHTLKCQIMRSFRPFLLVPRFRL